MGNRNQEWGDCIKALLQRHNLSWRGAEIRCGGAVSSTYIGSMSQGKIPQYDTAVAFLAAFPREEAVRCLRAAQLPIPEEWDLPVSPLDAVEKMLGRAVPTIPEQGKQQIRDFIKEKMEQYGIPVEEDKPPA